MTWIELTWMLTMAAFIAGGALLAFITDDVSFFGVGMVFALFALMGGMVASTINAENTPYKTTSQFETTPVTTILTSEGLNVITDKVS